MIEPSASDRRRGSTARSSTDAATRCVSEVTGPGAGDDGPRPGGIAGHRVELAGWRMTERAGPAAVHRPAEVLDATAWNRPSDRGQRCPQRRTSGDLAGVGPHVRNEWTHRWMSWDRSARTPDQLRGRRTHIRRPRTSAGIGDDRPAAATRRRRTAHTARVRRGGRRRRRGPAAGRRRRRGTTGRASPRSSPARARRACGSCSAPWC